MARWLEERNLADKHVYIVDDNVDIRRGVHAALSVAGFSPRAFASGRDFVESVAELEPGCVLLDLCMPNMDGLGVLEAVAGDIAHFHIIMISAYGDVSSAVRALRLGATDFLEKPFTETRLIEALDRGFEALSAVSSSLERKTTAAEKVTTLSDREREVLRGLLAGMANKQVAALLEISPRTVEMHRARMMEHLGVHNLSDALRTAFDAGLPPLDVTNHPPPS